MIGRLIAPLLSICLLALCAGLGWEIHTALSDASRTAGPKRTSTPAASGKIQQNAKPVRFRIGPIDDFREVVERPLFNESRRPIRDAPEKKPVLGPLNIFLSGIVIDKSHRIAHLRQVEDNRVKALRIGDAIGSWKVVKILPDRVVLRAGVREETVFLKKPEKARATPRKTRSPNIIRLRRGTSRRNQRIRRPNRTRQE